MKTTLLPSDHDTAIGSQFGASLSAISYSKQSTAGLLVGSPYSTTAGVVGAGAAYLFTYDADTSQQWMEQIRITPQDPEEASMFGQDVMLSPTGEYPIAVSQALSPGKVGGAYVFRDDGEYAYRRPGPTPAPPTEVSASAVSV